MEAYRKIKEIVSFIQMREDKGQKTYYSISAYKDGTIYDVEKDGQGSVSCESSVLTAIESLSPEKLIIVMYGGMPGKNTKSIGKWEIPIKQATSGQMTIIPQVQMPKSQPDFSGLNGLGGVQAYLDFHKQITDLEFDKRMLQFQIENLTKENQAKEKKINQLEKELDEIEDENEELNGVNSQLEKYVPGNFKIFGMDGTKVLGAVATSILDTYIKRNPLAISKLTGLDTKEIAGLLGNDEQQNQDRNQTANDTQTSVSEVKEKDEKDTAIEEVSKWLTRLSEDDFEKNFAIILFLYENPNEVDNIYEFIKTNHHA